MPLPNYIVTSKVISSVLVVDVYWKTTLCNFVNRTQTTSRSQKTNTGKSVIECKQQKIFIMEFNGI